MRIFGWWEKTKISNVIKMRFLKEDDDICPGCGGQGYSFNGDHYFADSEDYERYYPTCRRCHGTGRYHAEIDKYQEDFL